MSEPSPRVRAPHPRRIPAGPLALSLSLALASPGCSPGPASSPAEDGTTSKVPEIARRQKHMQDMIKKAESKASDPARPH